MAPRITIFCHGDVYCAIHTDETEWMRMSQAPEGTYYPKEDLAHFRDHATQAQAGIGACLAESLIHASQRLQHYSSTNVMRLLHPSCYLPRTSSFLAKQLLWCRSQIELRVRASRKANAFAPRPERSNKAWQRCGNNSTKTNMSYSQMIIILPTWYQHWIAAHIRRTCKLWTLKNNFCCCSMLHLLPAILALSSDFGKGDPGVKKSSWATQQDTGPIWTIRVKA